MLCSVTWVTFCVDGEADPAVEVEYVRDGISLYSCVSAYQYGCLTSYEREIIHKLCAQLYVTWQ